MFLTPLLFLGSLSMLVDGLIVVVVEILGLLQSGSQKFGGPPDRKLGTDKRHGRPSKGQIGRAPIGITDWPLVL